MKIRDYCVEYFDDTHTYLVDGIIVPSITQILKIKFGDKYDGIPAYILKRAAEKGNQIHEAIEKLCKTGEVEDFKEVKNFIFLQKHYKFNVLDNEVPVVLFDKSDIPVAVGRLDLVLNIGDEVGLGDIKRTSTLDKEYLAYQLNLYRLAYQQCYGQEITFLKGLHLREDTRKFVDIPIDEELTWKLIEDYKKMEE